VPVTGRAEPGNVYMICLYKITNTQNNKCYIGYTSKSLNERWDQHKTGALRIRDNRKFYNAIRKYGLEAWNTEVLLEVTTITEAKNKEIELISLYDSYNTGYNATKGGDGNNGIIMTEESNQKRSNALKGVPKSKETVEKFKQRTQTQEAKDKISKAHTGTKKPWVKWSKEQIATRAMTRRNITKKQFDEIQKFRADGLTIKEVAALVSLSNDMVKKWSRKSWDL